MKKTNRADATAVRRASGDAELDAFDFGFLGSQGSANEEALPAGVVPSSDSISLEQMMALFPVEETLFLADDYVEGDSVEDESRALDDYTPSITDGDFDDPAQRVIFKNLRDEIRKACNVNTKPDVRKASLEWIFVPGERNRKKLDFDTSCVALGARSVVVRAKTMHRLWESGIIIQDALPFLAALPPSTVINEIAMTLGDKLHAAVASQIWNWPSVHVEALRSMFPEPSTAEYAKVMNDLEAHGYIGINAARAYFISRNPSMISKARRSNWQFSTSIAGEY